MRIRIIGELKPSDNCVEFSKIKYPICGEINREINSDLDFWVAFQGNRLKEINGVPVKIVEKVFDKNSMTLSIKCEMSERDQEYIKELERVGWKINHEALRQYKYKNTII